MTFSQQQHGWYRYIKGYHLVVVLPALLSACFLLFAPSPHTSALTTVPTKMNFQGRLTDASGNIKPNGSYNMRLKLYTVSTAGSAVWSEDRLVSATQGVTVTNGLFSIQLGEITSLPASLFASGALYLEVELPTPASATTSSPVWTEGPMTPRNQMATSAYAYNAETIDGLDSAAFGQLSTANTWSGTNVFSGSLQGSGLDTSSASALTFGSTNATAINLNQNATLAAGKTLTITGGITGARPSSPTEGMVYYDTTTKQLLTYANGKWQADRSNSTKIVAASNSSQAAKDSADYVADGAGDQAEINAALTAAAGGRVYLTEGTFTVTGSINMPNNTTLAGAGNNTIITVPNSHNVSINVITNSDTTNGNHGITLRDFTLDGNKANNISGIQSGVGFSKVGQPSNSNPSVINHVLAKNFRNRGVAIDGTTYPKLLSIINSTSQNNEHGFELNNQDGLIFSHNTASGNALSGAYFNDSTNLTITGNVFSANNTGVSLIAVGNSVFNGNNINKNTCSGLGESGLRIQLSWDNVIAGNNFNDNCGTTAQSSINIHNDSDTNTITGNTIVDTAGTGYAIRIASSTEDNNYLSGNTFHGTGATSIQDLGTGTIYANQLDGTGNLINRNPGGFSVGKTTAGTSFDLQGAIRNAVLPTPSAPTLSTAGTAGATTYGYRVAALDGLGETLASTETTIATGNAILDATNYINVTWPQVGGAVQYKVYRSTSAGTPATTGLIRTVAGNVLATTDTGIAASGSVATSNTTGQASFGGAIQGGSSLTLGTTSVAGSLVISDGSSNTATITVGALAGNYTYTIPVTTASDTFCMQTLANCGGGSGVTTVGALDGGTANANGATISGTTIYLQGASATYAGLVTTTTQTFAGNKTFSGTLTVSSSATFSGQLTVGTDDTTGTLLVVDTKTDAGDPVGTAGAIYYNSSLGKFRCYQGAAWTDCIGSGGGGGTQRVTLVPEYVGGVLAADGTNNNVNVTASSSTGLSLAQGYKHNFYQWDTTASTAQDYDIIINYQLPSNFTSFVTGSFRLWTYADSLTSTDTTFLVKSSTDALCYASAVSVKPTASGTWENKAPGDPGNGCTFAANDIITFVIKPTVIQPSTNKVRIGELRFEYQ